MKDKHGVGLRLRHWILAGVTAFVLHTILTLNAYALELKDCGLSEPDDATADFCVSLGIPRTCFLPDLSAEEQRGCDQQRFQEEPHFNVVRLSAHGAIRSIELLRTDTGRTVFTAHPHGTTFAVPADGDHVVWMHTEFLQPFLTARPTPGTDGHVLGLRRRVADRLEQLRGSGPRTVPQLYDQYAEFPRRTGELQFTERRQQHRRTD